MRELYVYYRVAAGRVPQADAALRSMRSALLAAHPGLTMRLLGRTEPETGLHTWMEIWAMTRSSAGVDARIEADIESRATALAACIDGRRHSEAFESLPDD